MLVVVAQALRGLFLVELLGVVDARTVQDVQGARYEQAHGVLEGEEQR